MNNSKKHFNEVNHFRNMTKYLPSLYEEIRLSFKPIALGARAEKYGISKTVNEILLKKEFIVRRKAAVQTSATGIVFEYKWDGPVPVPHICKEILQEAQRMDKLSEKTGKSVLNQVKDTKGTIVAESILAAETAASAGELSVVERVKLFLDMLWNGCKGGRTRISLTSLADAAKVMAEVKTVVVESGIVERTGSMPLYLYRWVGKKPSTEMAEKVHLLAKDKRSTYVPKTDKAAAPVEPTAEAEQANDTIAVRIHKLMEGMAKPVTSVELHQAYEAAYGPKDKATLGAAISAMPVYRAKIKYMGKRRKGLGTVLYSLEPIQETEGITPTRTKRDKRFNRFAHDKSEQAGDKATVSSASEDLFSNAEPVLLDENVSDELSSALIKKYNILAVKRTELKKKSMDMLKELLSINMESQKILELVLLWDTNEAANIADTIANRREVAQPVTTDKQSSEQYNPNTTWAERVLYALRVLGGTGTTVQMREVLGKVDKRTFKDLSTQLSAASYWLEKKGVLKKEKNKGRIYTFTIINPTKG